VFLESEAVKLPHDPDIFERALRGLQPLPLETIATAIGDDCDRDRTSFLS
jgi:hypothetical protein